MLLTLRKWWCLTSRTIRHGALGLVLPLSQVRSAPHHETRMKNLMDAKIDAYIALNPKHWRGIQAMPREHLERTLVALYVQRQEAHERTRRKLPNEKGQP